MRGAATVAIASLLLAARPAAAESYRELVEAYVGGDRGAVERVAARPRSEPRAEIQWLQRMRSCVRCGERELADRFPFLGAVLLHTERAFREVDAADEEASRFHLDVALQLLAAAPPEVRVHEPKWFVVVGFSYLQRVETAAARKYFATGASHFPAEVLLPIGLGAALEAEVRLAAPADTVHSTSPRFARQSIEQAAEGTQGLIAAEDAYRRAIAVQPDSAEARLRRGRVLLDLGRADEGESELAWVAAHAPAGRLQSLALLFRGLRQERAGRWSDAASLYRQAAAAGPPGARAAAVALAHALDRAGDVATARTVLDEVSRQPGPVDPFDVYLFGPPGELERALGELRAAAATRTP